jgi:hypothetical protein
LKVPAFAGMTSVSGGKEIPAFAGIEMWNPKIINVSFYSFFVLTAGFFV